MSKIGYLGIDVSKGYSDFITLQSDKEVAESPFRLYDVAEGHEQLGKIIDGLFKKKDLNKFIVVWKVPVVMKITG